MRLLKLNCKSMLKCGKSCKMWKEIDIDDNGDNNRTIGTTTIKLMLDVRKLGDGLRATDSSFGIINCGFEPSDNTYVNVISSYESVHHLPRVKNLSERMEGKTESQPLQGDCLALMEISCRPKQLH
ncbi:hypothetical protein Ancab_025576 [Ancistrocladus abbreviatus]